MRVYKLYKTPPFFIKLLCLSALWTMAVKSSDTIAQSFSGSFYATAEEVSYHKSRIDRLADVMTSCMRREYNKHLNFYSRYGISPFYGSNSSFKRLSYQGKRRFLRNIGKDPNLVDQMSQTSCVGFASECMAEAFRATNQGALWSRINSYASRNNWDGSAIIDALRHLGWYVMYWNPDPSNNEAWDRSERARMTTNDGMWGYHAYRYATATKYKKYYKNHIDDASTLVGFGASVPSVLDRAPLFFGIAHAGYHVYPGSYGTVIESHSTRDIRDYYTMESDEFNPIRADGKGAPRGKYYSGLVAVPPGYEPGARSSRRGGFFNWFGN